MSAHAPDHRGLLVAGRYRLREAIGEGGFGRVYRAQDQRLGVQVAVKVIHPWWAQDREWVARLEEEARTAAGIGHPGVVRVTDVGTDSQIGPYTVAELVEGESLRSRLERDGCLDLEEGVLLISQAAQALGAAHDRRIVHRDVKPGNLLIGRDDRVRVCDFGIARLQTGATRSSATHTILGTPGYMSPEQFQGRAVGPASDQYSLAVVLYELLAGCLPFERDTPFAMGMAHAQEPPPSAPAGTPAHVADAIARALSKAPAERFNDVRAFAAAIEGADAIPTRAALGARAGARIHGRRAGVRAATAPTAALARRGGRRRVAWLAATGGAAAVIAVVLALTGAGERGATPTTETARASGEPPAVSNTPDPTATATPAPPPRRVRVPRLAGLPEASAKRLARRRGLIVETRREASRATTAGHVSSQEPTAGERVDEYATVELTVSTGPPPADVPRLAGRSLSDARASLSALGLRAETREVAADEPAGTVVRVRPRAGTSLPAGSAVTLDVARQPAWRPVGTYTLTADGSTPPLEISGRKWRITYTLQITDCEYEVIGCKGPSLTIDSDDAGYDDVDLSEGTHVTYGPSERGSYRLTADSLLDDTTYTLKLVVDEYS